MSNNKEKMTFVFEYDAKLGCELIGKLIQSMSDGVDIMDVRVTAASMGDDIERLERYEELVENCKFCS